LRQVFFVVAAASKNIEQAPASTGLRSAHAAAAAARHGCLKFSLAALIAASTRERLALLLELGEFTPRILDAVVHLETFWIPDQAFAEDEEGALKATGVVHGGASTLEHPVGLRDLLIDAGNLFAVGAPATLGRDKLLLELEAAHLLLAHALGERESGRAEHARAAKGERR
jgi:hypothetical protein